MLHAVIHGKSSRWLKDAKKKFSTQSEGNHQRIPREDEITSTIFGVMKYLDSKAIYRFFRLLSRQDIPNNIHITHEIVFWSRKQHKWKDKSIKITEPDLLVSFCVDGKKENYIVELKWGINSQFMEDQLEREWENFQEEKTCLIYIASSIHPNFYEKKKNYPWYAVTWLQFLEIVLAECNNTELKNYHIYMNDLKLFLEKLNIKRFNFFPLLRIPSYLVWDNKTFELVNFTRINVPQLKNQWKVNNG
jgi:hypothetical protein